MNIKRKNIFLVVVALVSLSMQGQQISPDVIVSAGGNFTASSGIGLSFSIGECVTETFTAPSVTLSQGFQQGYYEVIPSSVNQEFSVDMNVYPLPATDYITIELSGAGDNYRAGIYDIDGRMVLSGELTSESTNLDLADLVTGTYILVITDESNNTLRTMQIIKY